MVVNNPSNNNNNNNNNNNSNSSSNGTVAMVIWIHHEDLLIGRGRGKEESIGLIHVKAELVDMTRVG